MSHRLATLILIGLSLNLPCEYLLIPTANAFIDIPRIAAALIVTLADVLFLMVIYWALKLYQNTHLGVAQALYIVAISVFSVSVIEWLVTTIGIWSYKESVITIPFLLGLHSGILIHYAIVPLLTLYITLKITKPEQAPWTSGPLKS